MNPEQLNENMDTTETQKIREVESQIEQTRKNYDQIPDGILEKFQTEREEERKKYTSLEDQEKFNVFLKKHQETLQLKLDAIRSEEQSVLQPLYEQHRELLENYAKRKGKMTLSMEISNLGQEQNEIGRMVTHLSVKNGEMKVGLDNNNDPDQDPDPDPESESESVESTGP